MTMTATKQNGAGAAPRMTLANITRGRRVTPIKVVVAGVEGVGKSTFAADAPSPIFLCSEDGTAQLDVARFPTPRTWTDVLDALRVLKDEEHGHKTLAVDSLDWLEPIIWAHVCQAGGKKKMSEFAYGAGLADALDHWRTFVAALSALEAKRKMNVILIAHTTVMKVEEPGQPAYDRYQMKLHKNASALMREWVDSVLFCRHDVRVSVEAGKKFAKGKATSSGRRIMHTTWSAAYDAKNRFNLPDPMPLSWRDFEEAIRKVPTYDVPKLRADIEAMRSKGADAGHVDTALAWGGNDGEKLTRALSKLEDAAEQRAEEEEASHAGA